MNKLFQIILPFIFRTIMIKELGVEYLGINSLFTSILQVLSLSELGVGAAIVFSMYEPIANNDENKICALLSFYRKIYFYIGCIILCFGLILLPFISYLISGDYPSNINIYFVYVMFLLNTSISYFLFAYRGALLNAFQRNDLVSKATIIVSFFRYSIEIVVICITKQYYLFLVLEIASTVLNNIIKLKYTKKYFPQYSCKGKLDAEQKLKIRKNVVALMCHKIGGTVLNSADYIVLSAFMGVVIVANYSNYYYIMNSISGIVTICFTGMTAGIGNSFVVETEKKNRENFRKVLFFNAWIVGVCSVCFVCLYQDFIDFWLGEEYLLSDNIMLLIVLYFFVHNIRRTIIVFRDGAGMWRDNMWQPIISALFNLILNIVLVNIIGLAGVLISSILSMLIIDIPWETNAFCKKINMKCYVYIGALLQYLFITVLAIIVSMAFSSLINFSLIINIVIKGIIAVLVSNIIFYIILRKKSEFVYFKQLIKRYARKIFDKI